MSNVIELEKVSFAYSGVTAVDSVSLNIKKEEFIGLIGPNAGGKTTLVKLILGLLQADSGSITVLGKKPASARTQIGYVPQRPVFNRNFPITVKEAVNMGTISAGDVFGSYSREQRETGSTVMEMLNLASISDQAVNSLSGGQLQRVWIARALVCQPEILMLDEPTANIDVQAEEDIFDLLKKYNSHMTILVVSHDIAFISSYVDRVACMNQTLVCHDVEAIDGKTFEELYGGHVSMIHHGHHNG